ncbi:hypothetical protein [Thermoactinomyces sp. DSM 45892]|uniref:hypothetical protein n=1 Tax=Thermoactinomyces sp. DSM 45892 TaxID=1882753 RepID=UPI00089B2915|nr:hypothetical protein [Thermoactinomyces sp. DSM 45892]SDY83795.1 hypothetical protein SAMN05444416_10936 [Thermoactinomyces sp. DSM 45892]
MKWRKKVVKFFISVIVIILLIQIPFVQKGIATISTYAYVTTKYYDQDLQFQSTEFEPHFDDYFVHYKDKKGESVYFTVTPYFFPVLVIYDPLDPE